MSTSPYLQYFEGPAKRGLRSIRAGHEAAIGLALIYASIGASLGILSGTAIAIQVFPSNGPAALSDLAQASASVAGLKSPLKTFAAQIPMLQSQSAAETTEVPTTAPAPVAMESKNDKKAVAISPKVSTHKRSFSNTLETSNEAFTETPQSVDSKASPTTEAASSNEVAMVEVPVVVPSLMIEGDATVADYDATTGMVETHEGKSFSIGLSAGASNSWDEYSGHVHYRCDGGGNCTLSRAGVVVPHARLTT
jgi:hypothetical protein